MMPRRRRDGAAMMPRRRRDAHRHRWMPPRWSQSGRHEFTLDVRTEDDGTATIVEPPRPVRGLALATGIKWAVDRAAWRVDQDRGACTLRMVLEHQGLEVSDCVLDPGELSLAIPFFPPATISRKEGLMSIIAYFRGADIFRRRVAATPRLRRGYSVGDESCSDAVVRSRPAHAQVPLRRAQGTATRRGVVRGAARRRVRARVRM